MRLEVLRLLVLRNVLEERRLVHEALVARVTLVRLVGLVTSVNREFDRENNIITVHHVIKDGKDRPVVLLLL